MWNYNYSNYPRMNPNMNYNNSQSNQFNTPLSYPPLQQQSASPVPQYQQPQSANSQNNLIWVMGKENARSMQLQPNSSVIMLDNDANKFYIKTTDDIGLGRLRVFTYTEESDVDSPNQ